MGDRNQDEDGIGCDAANVLRMFEEGRLLPRSEAAPHLRDLLETRIDQLPFRLAGAKGAGARWDGARWAGAKGEVVRIPGERA